MSSLFEAYITNLGKYNEGRLVGETLKFPATTEEVQALLKRIGVDGVRYEEIFITSFDGDVLGLYDHLGEYESIDELNHLAHVLSDLDQSDIEKFEAVIDSGEYTGSVHDLINLAQNLDCYDFYPGIDSEEALGRAYIEEMEMLDVPDNVLPYVNVPNDLSKIKTKIAFNLTRRQLICFGGAAAVGIPVYLLTRHALGGTGAMFLMIALMLPAFFMAMYERDGLPFEKVARNIIRAKFLRPGVRPYQTQNIYAPFAGKEVTLEQKPQEVKKPDAGR